MLFRNVFDHVLTAWATIAAAVFAMVTGTLLVAIVVNRAKRRDELPFHASKNTKLELGYAVLLASIVGALVTGSFVANAVLNGGAGAVRTAAESSAERIDVAAFRWCWEFSYRAAPVRVTGDCRLKQFPTIVVPAGRPVEFDLTSLDVVHAFWLPDFAIKRDMYPNHVNRLHIVFPREGRWRGRCSEYCGTHHWTMEFYVRAVSPERYRQYLAGGGALVRRRTSTGP